MEGDLWMPRCESSAVILDRTGSEQRGGAQRKVHVPAGYRQDRTL